MTTSLPSARASRPIDADLHAWLDRCRGLSPEYGAALSTHLPMALAALQGLGAAPQRLRALFDRIAPGLPRRPTGAAAALDEPAQGSARWPARLGRFDDFETLHATMARRAADEGIDTLLRQALPVLMPGVAAVAFHGLIRTAHGMAAGHAGEVVIGLAYWASRHAPLAPPAPSIPHTPATPGLDLPAWLQSLQRLPAPTGAPARLILSRMQAWSAVPGFRAAASALRLQPDTLDDLARQAAGLYAGTGNFTVLHLVTACHALRTLRPWLDDEPAALRPFTIAAAAALRASGWPGLTSSALPATVPGWPEIVARAITSEDEHVIKLVHACRALGAAGDDALFQAAAWRAAQPTPAR